MGHNINSFIVDAEQATQALADGHERPVPGAYVRVELQVLWHIAPSSQHSDLPLLLTGGRATRCLLLHPFPCVLATQRVLVTDVPQRRVCCPRMMLVVPKRRRAGGMPVENIRCTRMQRGNGVPPPRVSFLGVDCAVTASLWLPDAHRPPPSVVLASLAVQLPRKHASILFIARGNATPEYTRPVYAGSAAGLAQKCHPEAHPRRRTCPILRTTRRRDDAFRRPRRYAAIGTGRATLVIFRADACRNRLREV